MFSVNPVGGAHSLFHPWSEAREYAVDTWQRNILFLDILRQRGNIYLEHLYQGQPPVLTFPYQVVLEGRDLNPAVNYSLLKIQNRRAPGSHQKDQASEHRHYPEITEQAESSSKRPIVIIDPRAGHGPGIGGSKQDSQVGNALSKGHPVYFVIFSPEPEPGQTLADVHKALERFIEEVHFRHPKAKAPMIIGNCQAGWASALIGAERPEISGPLVLNGAPLSFWASKDGQNPMTYKAGLGGGTWLASFLSDLGNGRFDGANLVANFEDLNPANTMWSKLYNLYSRLDKEVDRFLGFEKWWGGFYLLNAEEIHFIVDQLFVANKLEHGILELAPGKQINLQNIEEPVLIFSSRGDNITPPHQALNWINAVYGSVEELIRQNKVLVYMVHERIGHLGIFVSQSVARKEHQQILENIEHIRFLPAGLYEMVIEEGLEKQDYQVRFEKRTFDDLMAAESGMQQSRSFQAVAAVSLANDSIYHSYFRPWVRMASNELSATILRQLHPLRLQRYLLSDLNPWLWPVRLYAPWVKEHRQPAPRGNFFKVLETEMARVVENNWEVFRKYRDSTMEFFFKLWFENPFVQDHFLGTFGEEPRETEAHPKQAIESLSQQTELTPRMRQGGFQEAVVRCLLALMNAKQALDTRELKCLKDILNTQHRFHSLSIDELIQVIRNQSALLCGDQGQALSTLRDLLPSREDREQALALLQQLAQAVSPLSAAQEQIVQEVRDLLGMGELT
ncbi:MAG: DUF3141 domain-containing protein [Desulfohalobiaceae bacterium]